MLKFTLTEKAKNDLKEIARFTQKRWGREQRNNYLATLDSSFQRLAENPSIGKDCSEVKDGYQKLPAGSHVIYYRCPEKTPLQIVRILHESMDVELQFSVNLSDRH